MEKLNKSRIVFNLIGATAGMALFTLVLKGQQLPKYMVLAFIALLTLENILEIFKSRNGN